MISSVLCFIVLPMVTTSPQWSQQDYILANFQERSRSQVITNHDRNLCRMGCYPFLFTRLQGNFQSVMMNYLDFYHNLSHVSMYLLSHVSMYLQRSTRWNRKFKSRESLSCTMCTTYWSNASIQTKQVFYYCNQ